MKVPLSGYVCTTLINIFISWIFDGNNYYSYGLTLGFPLFIAFSFWNAVCSLITAQTWVDFDEFCFKWKVARDRFLASLPRKLSAFIKRSITPELQYHQDSIAEKFASLSVPWTKIVPIVLYNVSRWTSIRRLAGRQSKPNSASVCPTLPFHSLPFLPKSQSNDVPSSSWSASFACD